MELVRNRHVSSPVISLFIYYSCQSFNASGLSWIPVESGHSDRRHRVATCKVAIGKKRSFTFRIHTVKTWLCLLSPRRITIYQSRILLSVPAAVDARGSICPRCPGVVQVPDWNSTEPSVFVVLRSIAGTKDRSIRNECCHTQKVSAGAKWRLV